MSKSAEKNNTQREKNEKDLQEKHLLELSDTGF